MLILIVDDQPVNLKLLRVQLESAGHEVISAPDGVEALAILGMRRVDAIISDILMPRMDGYRLCHEIRKSASLNTIPFVFYTSTYTSPSDEKLCYDLGADKYLKKPAPESEILKAIREIETAGPRDASRTPLRFDELAVTEEYSERLVAKLEEKNLELECAKADLNKANFDLKQANDELHRVNAALKQANTALRRSNDELEHRVSERTSELEMSNKALEAFSFSVSHDLQAPLRSIRGFSQMLLEDSTEWMKESDRDTLGRVMSSTDRMGTLIDSLLEMSRSTYGPLVRARVDLSEMAESVFADLRCATPGRKVETRIHPGLVEEADANLIRIVLTNLLGNAWKYTGKTHAARIEFGADEVDGTRVYFVRDNGAGFDMARSAKLFRPFQRLHRTSEFEGSGIGLSTVQRIIRRHGGDIEAEAAPGRGATFRFTLRSVEKSESPLLDAAGEM